MLLAFLSGASPVPGSRRRLSSRFVAWLRPTWPSLAGRMPRTLVSLVKKSSRKKPYWSILLSQKNLVFYMTCGISFACLC